MYLVGPTAPKLLNQLPLPIKYSYQSPGRTTCCGFLADGDHAAIEPWARCDARMGADSAAFCSRGEAWHRAFILSLAPAARLRSDIGNRVWNGTHASRDTRALQRARCPGIETERSSRLLSWVPARAERGGQRGVKRRRRRARGRRTASAGATKLTGSQRQWKSRAASSSACANTTAQTGAATAVLGS